MIQTTAGSSLLTGLLLGASLIIAIGAQNSFVLRQGIRREHVGPVVATCALIDIALMCAGVLGLGALVTAHPGWLTVAALGGAAVLGWYGLSAFRRAWQPGALQAGALGDAVGSSRVDLQACKLEYSIVSPK